MLQLMLVLSQYGGELSNLMCIHQPPTCLQNRAGPTRSRIGCNLKTGTLHGQISTEHLYALGLQTRSAPPSIFVDLPLASVN